MARPVKVAVTLLAGPPAVLGRMYDATEFADALLLSAQAVAAGYAGTVYCVMSDGTFARFNTANKAFEPVAEWPFA